MYRGGVQASPERGIKMRIKKVKITNEKKISMVYEKETRAGGWDEYSFTCSEEAKPEFYNSMNSLKEHVIEMCELPDSYIGKITVKGVSFSYAGEKEVMGATISASMDLQKSYPNLNLNTPHKASDSYSDAPPDDMQILTSECIQALLELQKQCVSYIEGDRAQMAMFNVA